MAGLLPFLRLLRAGTLFSPAADVLAGTCIAAAAQGAAVWSLDVVRAVAASVLVYAAGMVLNDVADRRADAVHRPERPLPSGQVGVATAALLGAALLLGAVALTPARPHHLLLAVLVVAYDFALKRHAVLAAATMAVLRGLNLATGAAVLGGALPSNLLAAAACYGGYIFAVTILGGYEDEPPKNARAVVAVQTAPVLLAFSGLLVVQGGLWPAPALAAMPLLWFARRNRLRSTWDQEAIRGSMLLLLLGTMLYTGLLCLAAGRPLEAVGTFCAIPLARAVTARLRQRQLT